MIVTDMLGDAGSVESIAPADTATGLAVATRHPTSGIYKGMTAKGMLVTCEDQTVNFTMNGTAPTAKAGTNVGHELAAGQSIVIRGQESIRNFLCIDRVSGSTGTIKVTCYF